MQRWLLRTELWPSFSNFHSSLLLSEFCGLIGTYQNKVWYVPTGGPWYTAVACCHMFHLLGNWQERERNRHRTKITPATSKDSLLFTSGRQIFQSRALGQPKCHNQVVTSGSSLMWKSHTKEWDIGMLKIQPWHLAEKERERDTL